MLAAHIRSNVSENQNGFPEQSYMSEKAYFSKPEKRQKRSHYQVRNQCHQKLGGLLQENELIRHALKVSSIFVDYWWLKNTTNKIFIQEEQTRNTIKVTTEKQLEKMKTEINTKCQSKVCALMGDHISRWIMNYIIYQDMPLHNST